MTLNQLKVFVLVVRLGSFRAAANALGVSEPAVSQAITALRQSLGDPLLVRGSSGIELTTAGQRVVGLASQMVNLAMEAEAAVRQAQGGPALLRVMTTATLSDAVVPALLQAFMRRAKQIEATLGTAATEEMGALLIERLADVIVGPRLAGPDATGVISEPLMRYRLVLVVGRSHPLLRVGAPVSPRRLADLEWFVDPCGTDPHSDVGLLLGKLGVGEHRLSVFPSQTAAWAAAASGEGIAPAVEHWLALERSDSLAVVPVAGLPLEHMWYSNTLASDKRPAPASSLHRFLSSPEAVQAMFRADGRVPASRFKPPVHVTLWS